MTDLTSEDYEKNTWDVIDSYFAHNKGYQLVKHQLESFNDFILRKLDQIIDGFNPIEIQHQFIPDIGKFKYAITIEIKNPILNKPIIYEKDGSTKTMTPNDARQRNFTYSSNITVDLHITTRSLNEENEYVIDTKQLNNVLLGKIPIMVKSNYCILNNKFALINGHECKYDYGGYFIINGNEKVVISQDRISENKTYVFINNKVSTYSHVAEIRSVQENKLGVPKITTLKLSAKGNQFGRYIRANIHHIKNDVPIFILFKALGLNNDKEIMTYILHDLDDPLSMILAKELIGSIEEANNIQCPKDALEYLSKYLNITGYPKEILNNKVHRINIIRNVLCTEFLPHVGREFHKKALYLGSMVNKLIKCFLHLKEFDDRDSYINKKIDSPGVLMANLFRQYYGKVIKDMKNMVQKEINVGGWKATNKFINVINKVNIYKIIKSTIIDSGMRYALATGNWGIKNNKNKQGVAQVLNRMTYSATISHMRRINTPIEKSGKLVQPRKLHPTQWGIICPSETPEGASVGLVKNMSMICSITISSNSTNVREIIVQHGAQLFTGNNIDIFHKNTKVIVNGDIVGVHSEPDVFYAKMKDEKLSGAINIYTSIVWNIKEREISICTEGGRCVRPLYVINNDGKTNLTKELIEKIKSSETSWKDLLVNTRVIEFLDVEESNTLMIAMKYPDLFKGNKGSLLQIKYTHLEIHPSLILGVLASTIPFSDHNQAPRNTYQSLMLTEPVLMADGTRKAIKDVKVGEEVITFDPITMNTSITKVINQYVRPTENKILRITTVSGRVITATEEHKFMTNQGWKEIRDFDDETCVGINIEPDAVSIECDSFDVFNEEILYNKIKDCENVPVQLKQLGLMNLKSTDVRVNILARMLGYMMTGSYYKNNNDVNIWFDAEYSAELFENDVEYLGFTKSSIEESNNQFDCYKVNHKDAFANLFVGLGVKNSDVPQWIIDGSLMIKREFIAGYNGGYSLISDISRELDNLDTLYAEFGIQNNYTSKYFDMIGYRYNYNKIIDNAITIEYLKQENINTIEVKNITHKALCLFVPIKSIEEAPNCLISDITTESPNHSFIAGDNFMVHNSAQCKQAIGMYTLNYQERYDTLGHVMHYPQKPIVRTRMGSILNTDHMPNGINAIVAIGCYTGFNQEDSVLLNQSAVDRGLFVSTYYRTYKEQNNKNHSNGEEEFFTKPEVKSLKPFNYDKLAQNGFVPENTYIEGGDILIGKCMPNKIGNVINNKDNSIAFKNNDKGFVDRNVHNDNYFCTTNPEGYNFCKVRVRSDRIPTIGDKLSSRCFDEKTEILTTEGWLYVKDLTKEHKVATLIGDALKYQNPSELQVYNYKGKMYELKSNQVDLFVTPNHAMYVAKRFKNTKKSEYKREFAEDIFNQVRFYKKNADSWEPDYATEDVPKELVITDNKVTGFVIEGEIYDIDDWIKLFGIWIAEGCCDSSNINIAAHKERVQKVLNEVEKSMKITFNRTKYYPDDPEKWSWNISKKSFVRYYLPLSVGAINKYLPEWVWFLNRDQCQLLIKNMCLGDGHVMKNGTERYDTSSTRLADDFQRLCLHAGWSANKQLKALAGTKGGKNKNGVDIISTVNAWRLTIITSQNEPKINKNRRAGNPDTCLDKWTDFDGTVYCCTVPEGLGVVYVRRNGCTVWAGQSGQKGTCGILYRQEDMPFTKDGIVPDLIMNPHAIPSRMTIGQLIECIMGKACLELGTYGDSTPFTQVSVEEIADILENCGMERYGNEIMYNSRTGTQMETLIFIGPTYYQRLKHMTQDKLHSRSNNGPIVVLTRQPSEGRAREGGLRLGEMELECLWSYGTLQFLKERIMECSDNYRVFTCRQCGLMAIVNPEKGIYNCKNCKNNTNFAQLRVPFALKLLMQEIQSMNISTRFIT
jgi:DNA-directed RNA polymerase beta subunit